MSSLTPKPGLLLNVDRENTRCKACLEKGAQGGLHGYLAHRDARGQPHWPLLTSRQRYSQVLSGLAPLPLANEGWSGYEPPLTER